MGAADCHSPGPGACPPHQSKALTDMCVSRFGGGTYGTGGG